jgi:hypothetical protein
MAGKPAAPELWEGNMAYAVNQGNTVTKWPVAAALADGVWIADRVDRFGNANRQGTEATANQSR